MPRKIGPDNVDACLLDRAAAPFRRVAEDDQHRLQVATEGPAETHTAAAAGAAMKPEQLALPPGNTPTLDSGELWIQKYRAAIHDSEAPRKRFPRIFAALTAATVALGVIVYVFQSHLLR
jgi:hypothetical protein